MPNRVSIPDKRIGETVLLGANGTGPFNFVSNMQPTETISTAAVTCSVYSGNDPSPSAVVSGAATFAGTVVSQLITGGVLGTIYELLCTITTSLGQTLKLCGYLVVIPDLP